MLIAMYGRDYVPGRDSFFALLRCKGLMLPKPNPRHTTNSNHRYHKWKNLIKGFVPTAANRLWVADITYIPIATGDVCYLYLITDAYSHKVVGWALADTLRTAITIEALNMAVEEAKAMMNTDTLTGLIHHSDRGVQYCCDAYVKILRDNGISVSMTEDYNPTDNAVAESINGKIKVECVYRTRFNTFGQAREVIARYIHFYNCHRPHMSIGYKVPQVVHFEQGAQERMWKNKVYPQKNRRIENNPLSLRTTVP
ncbi:Integrase core domain [Segatella oris]|uniref:Integrase core domain n=2 Tax=Segatella oris TaxID=28135 RepID=A0A448L5F3_9BACT|nr:Integrase core domain [Segatella oris]